MYEQHQKKIYVWIDYYCCGGDDSFGFVENNCDEIDFEVLLVDMETFDPNDRTKSDITVSFLILVCVLSDIQVKKNKPNEPIIKVYSNEPASSLN